MTEYIKEIRDRFACAAIAGLGSTGDPEEVARYAYRLADAMLKTRQSWPIELDAYEEPRQ